MTITNCLNSADFTIAGRTISGSYWHSNLVDWTSLGTITFPTDVSGYILVRRLR